MRGVSPRYNIQLTSSLFPSTSILNLYYLPFLFLLLPTNPFRLLTSPYPLPFLPLFLNFPFQFITYSHPVINLLYFKPLHLLYNIPNLLYYYLLISLINFPLLVSFLIILSLNYLQTLLYINKKNYNYISLTLFKQFPPYTFPLPILFFTLSYLTNPISTPPS